MWYIITGIAGMVAGVVLYRLYAAEVINAGKAALAKAKADIMNVGSKL